VSQNLSPPIALRVRKSYLITGVVCAIGFAVIGTGSVLAAATNIDGSFRYPVQTAVFCGIFWGVWFTASLIIIAASLRERLTVTSHSITQQGVFRTRSIAISDIANLRWRTRPVGGGAAIRSLNARIKIHFDNFTAEERGLLITRLHELISEDNQENWDTFSDVQRASPLPPKESRWTAIACMALFLVTGAVLVYCWHIQFGPMFLVVGIASVLAGLWYLFRIVRYDTESEMEATE
jgi:hypothetical protein